jgi:polar amino acid transport system substrate-binding protein
MPPIFKTTCVALCLSLAAPAWAACSRPIQVPVSPLGVSVIVHGDKVSGVFPDMLEQLGARVGCKFVWSVVPRARGEVMFEDGRADLLVAATHSDKRDQSGVFIPLVASRASLVSVEKGQAPLRSMAQLLAQPKIRVALVRGYDYGPAYQELSRALAEQKRLFLEPDALSVARLLDAGMADATVLPSTAVAGAIATDTRIDALQDRLRIEPLDELPWSRGGIYVSSKSLSEADRATLEKMLEGAARSGALYKGYFRYFSPAVVDGSTRPL